MIKYRDIKVCDFSIERSGIKQTYSFGCKRRRKNKALFHVETCKER
jgi:hypothetical protein